tara:strand:- start:116 stop:331 length:216 start_codon:yes stop_codon:yes gene_type:complete
MAKILDILKKDGYSQLVLDDGTFKNVDMETIAKGKILVNSEFKSYGKTTVKPKAKPKKKEVKPKAKPKSLV